MRGSDKTPPYNNNRRVRKRYFANQYYNTATNNDGSVPKPHTQFAGPWPSYNSNWYNANPNYYAHPYGNNIMYNNAVSSDLQNTSYDSNYSNNYYKKVRWASHEPVITPIHIKPTENTFNKKTTRIPKSKIQTASPKISTLERLRNIIVKDKEEKAILSNNTQSNLLAVNSATENKDLDNKRNQCVTRTILNAKIISPEVSNKSIQILDLLGAARLNCEYLHNQLDSLQLQTNSDLNGNRHTSISPRHSSFSEGNISTTVNVFVSEDVVQRNVAVEIWKNKFLKKDTTDWDEQIAIINTNHWEEIVELKTNLFIHKMAIYRSKLISVIKQNLEQSDADHLKIRFDRGANIPTVSDKSYESLSDKPDIDHHREKIMGEVIENPYEEDEINYQKKTAPWNKKFWKNVIKAFKLFGKDFKQVSDFLGISVAIITQFYYDKEMELIRCFIVNEEVDDGYAIYPEDE